MYQISVNQTDKYHRGCFYKTEHILSIYFQLAMMSYSAQIDVQNVEEYNELLRDQERGHT